MCVSIGLTIGKVPIIGVVYNPIINEVRMLQKKILKKILKEGEVSDRLNDGAIVKGINSWKFNSIYLSGITFGV